MKDRTKLFNYPLHLFPGYLDALQPFLGAFALISVELQIHSRLLQLVTYHGAENPIGVPENKCPFSERAVEDAVVKDFKVDFFFRGLEPKIAQVGVRELVIVDPVGHGGLWAGAGGVIQRLWEKISPHGRVLLDYASALIFIGKNKSVYKC